MAFFIWKGGIPSVCVCVCVVRCNEWADGSHSHHSSTLFTHHLSLFPIFAQMNVNVSFSLCIYECVELWVFVWDCENPAISWFGVWAADSPPLILKKRNKTLKKKIEDKKKGREEVSRRQEYFSSMRTFFFSFLIWQWSFFRKLLLFFGIAFIYCSIGFIYFIRAIFLFECSVLRPQTLKAKIYNKEQVKLL